MIDEVITGFRLGLTGAQGFLGFQGDITLYAKAVASGYPMAVLGTSEELLDAVGRGEVNHSGTYNAAVLSVAAGVETLKILVEDDPYPELEQRTARLVAELRSVGAAKGLAIDHVGGSLFQFRFGAPETIRSLAQHVANSDQAMLMRFLDVLQDCGVRPTSRGLCFVSTAHDDAVIDATLERNVGRARDALTRPGRCRTPLPHHGTSRTVSDTDSVGIGHREGQWLSRVTSSRCCRSGSRGRSPCRPASRGRCRAGPSRARRPVVGACHSDRRRVELGVVDVERELPAAARRG